MEVKIISYHCRVCDSPVKECGCSPSLEEHNQNIVDVLILKNNQLKKSLAKQPTKPPLSAICQACGGLAPIKANAYNCKCNKPSVEKIYQFIIESIKNNEYETGFDAMTLAQKIVNEL